MVDIIRNGMEWEHWVWNETCRIGVGTCVWNGNKMGTTGIQTETIRNGMGTLGMGLLRMEWRRQV